MCGEWKSVGECMGRGSVLACGERNGGGGGVGKCVRVWGR